MNKERFEGGSRAVDISRYLKEIRTARFVEKNIGQPLFVGGGAFAFVFGMLLVALNGPSAGAVFPAVVLVPAAVSAAGLGIKSIAGLYKKGAQGNLNNLVEGERYVRENS